MPWPTTLKYLGKPLPRLDAVPKVTGAAKYASDVHPDGLLYGMILRSKWPAAKITKIDLAPAQNIPGVKATILAGGNQPNVRFYGQELAAVAAETRQACLDALRAIVVEADPLPFVVHEADAMQPDSPQVFQGRQNLSDPEVREQGQVDAAFGSAAGVVELEFATPVQMHHPMETHGLTAAISGGQLTAWASTQGIFSVREGLAGHLGLQQNNVQVICDYMGGGFGSKFGPGAEGGLAAKLSQIAGRPVKMMLTRMDEGLAVGNRPSSQQKLKIAADANGKLVAFSNEVVGTAGVGGGGNTAGGGGGADVETPYIYRVPNSRVTIRAVAVNAGAARAFRAPRHPQGSASMEAAMDDLAVKMGLDPLAFRLGNDESQVRRRELEIGRDRFGWNAKYKKPGTSPGPVKTGIGCAGSTWGGGGHGTQAEMTINPDGTVEVRCGTQDLGTGSRTVVGLVAAEALQLDPSMIHVRIGDTNFPPSGGSGGSTTTASVAPAIWDACQNGLTELSKQTGTPVDQILANWSAACRNLGVNPIRASGKWQEHLSSNGCGGVHFAEVTVDVETGYIRVTKMLAVHDCGLVVNPMTLTSQINGGVLMGMSYALYEERVLDKKSGVLLNTSFDSYKIANIADCPDIEVVIVDMPERGVIGVAETTNVPAGSAISNAVANAIGTRVHSFPITPRKVLAALGKVPNKTA